MILLIWRSEGKNWKLSSVSWIATTKKPHVALDELLVIIRLFLHWKMNIAWWGFAQMCDFASFYWGIFIYTCMPLTDNDLLVDCFMVLSIRFCSQHTPSSPPPFFFFPSGKKPSHVEKVFNHCHIMFIHQEWSHVRSLIYVVFIGWFPCVLSWLTQNSVISGPEVMKWHQECFSCFSSFPWDSVYTSLKWVHLLIFWAEQDTIMIKVILIN